PDILLMVLAFAAWSAAPWQYPPACGHRPPGQGYTPGNTPSGMAGGPQTRDALLATLEAYLFATPEPLSLRRLASLIRNTTTDDIKRQLKKLARLYEEQGSAWQLVELAGGYQLRTREAYLPWLLKLQPAQGLQLSPAARETLAIVAYRQPV
ncbi:MAG TPA: SMC-Scp complex subunit ScpB, partial [Gemmatales bacterium]|nr:SMC-Scp complex subunit ScpB [Gemmatales bacterium]